MQVVDFSVDSQGEKFRFLQGQLRDRWQSIEVLIWEIMIF